MRKLIVAVPSLLLGLLLAAIIFFVADPLLVGDFDPLLLWLLATGLVTFGYYGVDKAQSPRNGRRIPEWTLHGLALAGGVAGGWLGMFLFRHKTQKPLFRLLLLVATALWAWLLWR